MFWVQPIGMQGETDSQKGGLSSRSGTWALLDLKEHPILEDCKSFDPA